MKNIANIIENTKRHFKYDVIYPLFIIVPNALNGNIPIFPSELSAGAGILYALTNGTINTMAINSHSIPNSIKYFLFFLIAPSTL